MQRQDGTVVSFGPGQFGSSSSIASPILEYLHSRVGKVGWWSLNLSSIWDFVTCHLCPFVKFAGTMIPRDIDQKDRVPLLLPSTSKMMSQVGRKFSWPHAARALCCRLQDFDHCHLEEFDYV